MSLEEYNSYFNDVATNVARAFDTSTSVVTVREPRENLLAGSIPGVMFSASVSHPDYAKLPIGFRDALTRLDYRYGVQKALEYLRSSEVELYNEIRSRIPEQGGATKNVKFFKDTIFTVVNEADQKRGAKYGQGQIMARMNSFIGASQGPRQETYDVYLQIMEDRKFGDQPFGVVFCDGITSSLLSQMEAVRVQRMAANTFLDTSEASLYQIEQKRKNSSNAKCASSFGPNPHTLSIAKAFTGELLRDAFPMLSGEMLDDIATGINIHQDQVKQQKQAVVPKAQ